MLKKILLAILLLVFGVLLFGYFYLQNLKPTYSGELSLSGLNGQVEVYYDDFGVPHIYAKSEADAYMALGYVHAQDRLWQMEVIRRIASGRLSELFGKDLLEIDKFFKTLGIHDYSIEQTKNFSQTGNAKIKLATTSYLKGLNLFVENGATPIEHIILGIDKTPFSLVDVYNTIGYMSFSFAIAHKTEPIVSKIMSTLGAEYVNDLDIGADASKQMIETHQRDTLSDMISVITNRIMDKLPMPAFIGSNSWVVGSQMTKSGKVILVNDPHIAFSQPATWYEAHMEAPGFSLYGYHIAGYPFANLGHSRETAIGLTMFENDDIDLFSEKVNPENKNQYWAIDHWEDFSSKKETVKVKDSEDVTFEIRTTRHGSVINDVVTGMQNDAPVSMWWVYTQVPSKLLEANYQLTHARSIDEARTAASIIHAPGLNIMYGDKDDNIGWWAVGKMIKRPNHVNPKMILDGASGNDDPQGYYDFTLNPQAENPPWNYVNSSNNQPNTVLDGKLYPGYYLPEDRARRVVKLLEEDKNKKWEVADMKEMLLDQTSENVPEIAQSITTAIGDANDMSANAQKAIDILNNWDGNFKKSSTAPVIYNKLVFNILELIFKEKLGEESFEVFIESHLMKRSIQPLFANDSSAWWDNLTTSNVIESRKDIFKQALADGIASLETQLGGDMNDWIWEKVHILEHPHAFGKVAALKKYFNVGPYGVGANNEVINNYIFRLNGDGIYNVTAGPSTRRIIDFADVENNSWSILPTGQSGNVMSKHYKNQADMYVNGEYRRLLMNEKEIKETSKDVLILNPE